MAQPRSVAAVQLELLKGTQLSPADAKRMIASAEPATLTALLEAYDAQLRATRLEKKEVEAQLAQLLAPPQHAATVLGTLDGRRVQVAVAGRQQVLAAAPDLAVQELRAGDAVLVNNDFTAVVGRGRPARLGNVARVSEVLEGCLVVRGAADEETIVDCAPEQLEQTQPGDRVVLAADAPVVLRRLARRESCEFDLGETPDVPFDRIAGHDRVVARLKSDLDLHLRHPAAVREYRLEVMRGMLLIGPPGVGKTLIAKAVAHHLAGQTEPVRFLAVPPGAFRGMWYGSSEQRIRELFASARAFPGLVVVFLDEIDSYGARDAGALHDVDSRVMGALLHELDGLGSARNVLVIGATNRLDLCEDALVREGRLGDHRYFLTRPDRAAARAILSGYLTADLPYAHGDGAVELVREAALAHLYAPNGGAGVLARATLGDGSAFEIRPRDVVSGAMLASAVGRAKHAAAQRSLRATTGLAAEDLLEALDEALDAEARRLCSPRVAARALDHPRAAEIVRVELAPERRLRRHRHTKFE
jgi:proteasome-associated ATPase